MNGKASDDPAGRLEAEFAAREARALAMGGPEKLARRKAAGMLNARERIARLCDPGSFVESGLFATSTSNPADRDSTPCDGKITGFGKVDGCETAVLANDFTVMVVNFTPVPRSGYRIGVPEPGWYREILNSDAALYGGGNMGNGGGVDSEPVAAHGHGQSLSLVVPPLGCVLLKRS